MASAKGQRPVTAAGCVVVRPHPGGGEPDILLVHRPRYHDWSLPKGKLNPDEYLAGCAVRETREESNVTVRLGPPIPRKLRYPVNGGEKSVTYWRGIVVKERPHRPNAEVDEIRWLPVSEATAVISYLDELDVIRHGVALPETVPLVITRHAKAMLRSNWSGRDQARPLDARGRRQSELLVPLLEAFGVRRIVSSSSARCTQTMKPYAKATRTDVEAWSTISEEQAKLNPRSVTTFMKRIVKEVLQRVEPTVICGHRPVLPLMMAAAGLDATPLKPGAALIVHLGLDGTAVAVEEHRPRV